MLRTSGQDRFFGPAQLDLVLLATRSQDVVEIDARAPIVRHSFIAVVEDKATTDITRDDGRVLHRHWLGKVAPKAGGPRKSASMDLHDWQHARP